MLGNVTSMLILPEEHTETRPRGLRSSPFEHPFQPLGRPRAQPRGSCRSQHVPASQLQPDHARDAPPTAHPQPPQAQAVLQATVGRLDPRPRRVPSLEDIGLLLPTPLRQATLLVGVVQDVAALL